VIEVAIDDNDINLSENIHEGFCSLGDFLDFIRKEVIDPDLLTTSIAVDGKVLPMKDAKDWADIPLTSVKRIELKTSNWVNLIQNGLKSIKDYIDKLIPALSATSSLFRQNTLIEANKKLSECIDGIQWLLSLMLTVERNMYLRGSVDEQPMTESAEKLTGLLGNIYEAQKKEDLILLADLLEYELSAYFVAMLDDITQKQNLL
jgi:hypothetical protein